MAGPPKPDPKKAVAGKKPAEHTAEQEDVEQVLFQGPLFGRESNLKANTKLVQAALVPVKQMMSDALSRRAHTLLMELPSVQSEFVTSQPPMPLQVTQSLLH